MKSPPPSSSSTLALTLDGEGGVETLDAWLSRYNLSHAAPALRELGVAALEDLRDFDEEADITELGLKKVECRRFSRALRELVSGAGSEGGGFGATSLSAPPFGASSLPAAAFSTLVGVTPAPALGAPPRGASGTSLSATSRRSGRPSAHDTRLQRRGARCGTT